MPGSHSAEAAPTGLICGDVHGGELGRIGALVGNAVDRLDLEAVLRVGLQVPDRHAPLGQSQVARRDVHVVVAARTHSPVGKALLTDDVVEDIVAATQVTRLAPLQHERGFVDAGDDAAWGRWNGCKRKDGMRKIGRNENAFNLRAQWV